MLLYSLWEFLVHDACLKDSPNRIQLKVETALSVFRGSTCHCAVCFVVFIFVVDCRFSLFLSIRNEQYSVKNNHRPILLD